jgi:hypothetical protein
MSIILCTQSADLRRIVSRFAGRPCVYLCWGPPYKPQNGAAHPLQPDVPGGWDICDVSLAPPALEILQSAGLIVAAMPPASWQEPFGAATAERLRAAAATAAILLLGPSIEFAGEWRAHDAPGLNFIANTLILHDLQAVADLRALLASLSAGQTRLLALDGPVCVEYDPHSDSVAVSGDGSVLLAAFVRNASAGQASVRAQVLTAGSSSGWPA